MPEQNPERKPPDRGWRVGRARFGNGEAGQLISLLADDERASLLMNVGITIPRRMRTEWVMVPECDAIAIDSMEKGRGL